jgi:Kef-type K+ transport system membrane component KefB
MKKIRPLLFYVLIIGAFSLLVYFIIHNGQRLETGKDIAVAKDAGSAWDHFKETYAHNLKHPLAILLLQIVTIIVIARVFGFLFRKIGQPSVIGEIVAGIVLGPSLIGMYFPEFSGFLFPKESLGNLQFLSQIGLILFMFIVGMELDIKVLQKRAHEAVVISHASIILPFALGMGFAYFTYQRLAPAGINFMSFGLFMGIAMSITAFPVLARIVQEKGLMKTKLGNIAITCAAADDITAWCILAVVIAIVKAGSFVSSVYTIVMAIAYVFLMWKVVRPFFKRMGEIYTNRESVSKPVVGVFFIMLIVSSYVCELIGIHALFGAFMAGMIMPGNVNFRSIFIEKVEDVALVLLLPLFFVFTGLRTQMGLLNDPGLLGTCFIIIVVAVVGKFVGSALAAKIVGQTWRESLIIGSLMNTRGLVELVVLNIGYDLGVLNPQVFTMMVIMALVTTFMTGPALALINKLMPEHKGSAVPEEVEHGGKYKILISFSNPKKAKAMLRLAHSMVKRSASRSGITAMHLSPSTEINQYNSNEYERENFLPIKTEAKKLGLPLVTMFKPSQDVNKEITETANAGNYDMLLIGVGSSVFEGTLLGKILGFTTRIITPERLYETIIGKEKLFEETMFDEGTRQVLRNAKVPVGVYIDKDLEKADRIFIPIFSISDSFLLIYAQKLIQNNEAQIIILDASGVIKQNAELKETIRSIEQTAPNHITLFSENKLQKDFLEQQDLMIISMESWKRAVETQSVWLSNSPSTLIIKP